MRTKTTAIAALAVAGIITALIAAPAHASAISNSSTAPINATILGGSLTQTVSGATLSSVTLNGNSAQSATGSAAQWMLIDARGTGAAWAVTVSATDFTSAAGTVDTVARTITVGNLVMTPGFITSVAGSDVVPATSSVTMSGTAQSIVSAPAPSKGTYTLTPSFALNVPINAYRSNYSGTLSNGTINPYISTVTITIG